MKTKKTMRLLGLVAFIAAGLILICLLPQQESGPLQSAETGGLRFVHPDDYRSTPQRKGEKGYYFGSVISLSLHEMVLEDRNGVLKKCYCRLDHALNVYIGQQVTVSGVVADYDSDSVHLKNVRLVEK